jgi:hypothetical protein
LKIPIAQGCSELLSGMMRYTLMINTISVSFYLSLISLKMNKLVTSKNEWDEVILLGLMGD